MHRFFADENGIVNGSARLEAGDAAHALRVLRLETGARIHLFSGGEAYLAEISDVSDGVTARVLGPVKSPEAGLRITLYQGVPKGCKLDVTVQKCIELGVGRLVPVFMKRSVVSDKGNFKKKADRLRTIAEAAAKQSGRGIIPPVEEAEDFGDMLEELRSYPLVLFPYENEDGATMKDALQASHSQLAAGSSDSAGQQDRPRIAVVIGPEGGFADEEADALKALDNCHCVSLGKRILRTETAGMAALAMILYEIEL